MAFGKLGALGNGFGRLGGGKGGLAAVPNTLRAGAGSFILTGTDMTPKSAYVVPADLGTFALTGVAATLTSTAASYTGPGDIVSGAAAWGSPARAYSAAFAAGLTAVMDLVDQANANPITINILSTGFVNVAAITAWVAANSVSTIKVAKLYDQTGNGRHWTQATLGTMPSLTLSAINGLPALTSASASNTVMATANITVPKPYTLTVVYKRTSGTTLSAVIANGGGASVDLGASNAADTAYFTAGTATTGAATDNTFHALIGTVASDGLSGNLVVDGSATAGTPGASDFSAAPARIMRSHAGVTMDGQAVEFGIWPSIFNATQYGNVNTNQHSAANGYNF